MKRLISLAVVVAVLAGVLMGGAAFANPQNNSCFADAASAAPSGQAVPGPAIGDIASGIAHTPAAGQFQSVGVQALQEARQTTPGC
jgi:hypothetical protein